MDFEDYIGSHDSHEHCGDYCLVMNLTANHIHGIYDANFLFDFFLDSPTIRVSAGRC